MYFITKLICFLLSAKMRNALFIKPYDQSIISTSTMNTNNWINFVSLVFVLCRLEFFMCLLHFLRSFSSAMFKRKQDKPSPCLKLLLQSKESLRSASILTLLYISLIIILPGGQFLEDIEIHHCQIKMVSVYDITSRFWFN